MAPKLAPVGAQFGPNSPKQSDEDSIEDLVGTMAAESVDTAPAIDEPAGFVAQLVVYSDQSTVPIAAEFAKGCVLAGLQVNISEVRDDNGVVHIQGTGW